MNKPRVLRHREGPAPGRERRLVAVMVVQQRVNIGEDLVVIGPVNNPCWRASRMFKHFSQALGVVVVLGSAPAFAGSQQPDIQPVQSVSEPMLRPSLLQDPKLRQDIGITDQQSLAIEQIFLTSIQSLRAARKELYEHEALLLRERCSRTPPTS